MNITPLDIRKQVFNSKIWGYDPDEVKNFLEMIAAALETTNRDHTQDSEKMKSLETRLETYQKIEQNMQDTLMTAQRITDEIKANAQKEAELIVKDAQIRAHKQMEIAREKVLQYERDLATVRHQKAMFVSRFRSLVNTQLEMLHILETDSTAAKAEEKTIEPPVV